eukprot:4369679-Amphidinium_carterae.1
MQDYNSPPELTTAEQIQHLQLTTINTLAATKPKGRTPKPCMDHYGCLAEDELVESAEKTFQSLASRL